MTVRKPESRRRARALREDGWPLRRIANDVGAALSTVSLWVRDVQLPVEVPSELPASGVSSSGDTPAIRELRRCGRCTKDLPLTEFNRHPSGHQWWCRDCYRAYFRARARDHRRQVHLARRDRRQKARAFVADYLRIRCCSECGKPDPCLLEFHHLQQKRTVLCANCHRLTTAASRGSWRLDPEGVDRGSGLTAGESRNMAYVRDLLVGSRCVDCSDSRLVVLDFDHVGSKAANVTELARSGCSLQRLKDEVSHCEVRCANCHRRRTLGSASHYTLRAPSLS
jgi:hypothetical protein